MFFKKDGRDKNKDIRLDEVNPVLSLQQLLLATKANNSQQLSEYDLRFIERAEQLTLNFTGVCDAYCLLNDFLIEQQQMNTPDYLKKDLILRIAVEKNQIQVSTIDNNTQEQLKRLHQTLVRDPRLNWFGVNTQELEKTTIYGGKLQYSQRMQHMIAHIGEHLSQSRRAIEENGKENLTNLDKKFLEKYLSGNLSAHEIKELDKFDEILRANSSDFESIQTALHLYRYMIIFKTSSYITLDEEQFMRPRSNLMPLQYAFPHESNQELAQRIEALIPEGQLKVAYSQRESIGHEAAVALEYQLVMCAEGWNTQNTEQHHGTRLRGHYAYYMDLILDEMKKDSISLEKFGKLPYYTNEKGLIVEANFSSVSYKGKGGGLLSGISNKHLSQMIEDKKKQGIIEEWPGQAIYQHMKRLYMISLLTEDKDVAIEAQRRLEWWYSNVMPFCRGSAAVSEALSKSLLVSHDLLPARMCNVLPDLRAICQFDENEFIENYSRSYSYPESPESLPFSNPATVDTDVKMTPGW